MSAKHAIFYRFNSKIYAVSHIYLWVLLSVDRALGVRRIRAQPKLPGREGF